MAKKTPAPTRKPQDKADAVKARKSLKSADRAEEGEKALLKKKRNYNRGGKVKK